MGETVYRATNVLGRAALRLLGVRTTWSGLEHVPDHGPVILAANHVGFPDFVVVEQAAIERGRYVRFLCRHDIWKAPLVGGAMDRMRHVPVDRDAPAGAYVAARRLLREGEAVGIFPEAGVSPSFTVRSLMRGVASLARETGAPVVPVAVWGTQRIWTSGSRPDLTRGRRVDVRLGRPVTVGPGEDLTGWTQRLGGVLTEQLELLQQLPHHRPSPGEVAPWHPAHLGGSAPTWSEATDLAAVPRSAISPTWGPSRQRAGSRSDASRATRAGS